MFRYAVETERRFYLANDVQLTAWSTTVPGRMVEVELNDAWVWDMYRRSRFVPTVRVLTFKDVNVEELPTERSSELTAGRKATGAWGEDLVARWYEARGYEVLARNWRCGER